MFGDLFAVVDVWTAVLFVAGVGLLIVEMMQPGFGVWGIGGLVLLVIDVLVTAETLAQGLAMAAIIAAVLLLLLLTAVILASKGIIPRKLVLKDSTDSLSGFTGAADLSGLDGVSGVTVTPLRPAGIAELAGSRRDVVSSGEFIDRGAAVRVTDTAGNRIVVEKIENK